MEVVVTILLLVGIARLATRMAAGRQHRHARFRAHHGAFEDGFAAGLARGHEEGFDAGHEAGFRDGWERGRAQALAQADIARRRELHSLAADVLPLCWPDEHPPDRAGHANRVTGALLHLMDADRQEEALQNPHTG